MRLTTQMRRAISRSIARNSDCQPARPQMAVSRKSLLGSARIRDGPAKSRSTSTWFRQFVRSARSYTYKQRRTVPQISRPVKTTRRRMQTTSAIVGAVAKVRQAAPTTTTKSPEKSLQQRRAIAVSTAPLSGRLFSRVSLASAVRRFIRFRRVAKVRGRARAVAAAKSMQNRRSKARSTPAARSAHNQTFRPLPIRIPASPCTTPSISPAGLCSAARQSQRRSLRRCMHSQETPTRFRSCTRTSRVCMTSRPEATAVAAHRFARQVLVGTGPPAWARRTDWARFSPREASNSTFRTYGSS